MAKTIKHEDIQGYFVETLGDVPDGDQDCSDRALTNQGIRGIKMGRVFTVVHLQEESLRYRTPPGFDEKIEVFKQTGEFAVGTYALMPVGDAEDE